VTGSKPNRPAGIGRMTGVGHFRRALRWSVSPHPSPLPWGEGEPFSSRSIIQIFRHSPRGAHCSLSLRERVRVRGNDANYPLAYRTIPGLGESFGKVGGHLK
jgi:hypothetical protein